MNIAANREGTRRETAMAGNQGICRLAGGVRERNSLLRQELEGRLLEGWCVLRGHLVWGGERRGFVRVLFLCWALRRSIRGHRRVFITRFTPPAAMEMKRAAAALAGGATCLRSLELPGRRRGTLRIGVGEVVICRWRRKSCWALQRGAGRWRSEFPESGV